MGWGLNENLDKILKEILKVFAENDKSCTCCGPTIFDVDDIGPKIMKILLELVND